MENSVATLDAGTLERAVSYYLRAGSTARLASHLMLDLSTTARLISTPQFQAAVDKALRLEFKGDAAVSRRLLRSQVLDRKQSAYVRQMAAKALLAVGGYVAPKASDMVRAPDNLAEMTSDQLRQVLGKIESELAERSAPVNAQVIPVEGSQVLDML